MIISVGETAVALVQLWDSLHSCMQYVPVCLCISLYLCVFMYVGAKSIQSMSEWGCNSGIMVLQVKMQWTLQSRIHDDVLFFLLACKTLAEWSWFPLVVCQYPCPSPINYTHTHTHACTQTTGIMCGTRTYFMSKAHQLSMAYLMCTACCSL